MVAELVKIESESENIKSFYFAPKKPLRFVAGQFIELHIPHDDPDDRGEKRWFTLSSSPNDELLRITTKFAHPSSSYKNALSSLSIGSKLKMIEPMGDFVLPKNLDTPLVFIAGGMGITPFVSMASWLGQSNESRKIQIIIAVNKKSDLIFTDLINNSNFEVHKIISEPSSGWDGLVGRLNAHKINEIANGLHGKRLYISGPEPMVETLESDLVNFGIKKSELVLDFFPGYEPI